MPNAPRLPKSKSDALGQVRSLDRAIGRMNEELVAAWAVGDGAVARLLGEDLGAAYEARAYYAAVAL
jgi:hypothetical protein